MDGVKHALVDVPPAGKTEPTERIEIRSRSVEEGASALVLRRLRNGCPTRPAHLSRRPKTIRPRCASASTEPPARIGRVTGSRTAPPARMKP